MDFELNEYFFYIFLNAFVAWLLSLKVHFHHFRFFCGGLRFSCKLNFALSCFPIANSSVASETQEKYI